MRTTLMMLAAAAAPVYAQQPTQTAVQVFQSLATPSVAPQATAQQRAAALPALASVPADCEGVLIFAHIGDTAAKLNNIFGDPDDELPEELLNLHSAAIAFGKGSALSISELASVVAGIQGATIVEGIGKNWSATADAAFADTIKKEASLLVDKLQKEGNASLSKIVVHPIYGVLTAKPGAAAMMQEWHDAAIENLQTAAQYEEAFSPVSIKGMRGISIRIPESQARPSRWDSEAEKLFKQEVGKRTFYLLFAVHNNALVTVFTENPDEIVLPDASQSILSTDKLAGCDPNLGKPILFADYGSSEFAAAWNKLQAGGIMAAARSVSSIFATLAQKSNAGKQDLEAAAKGVTVFSDLFAKIISFSSGKGFAQIYLDKGNIEVEAVQEYAQPSASYKPGQLRLLGLADKDNTILYSEGTSASMDNIFSVQLDELANHALGIVKGGLITLSEENRKEASACVAQAMAFLPDAQDLFAALGHMRKGLGNTTALVIDSAGSVPPILGGTPANAATMPRLAFYSGVTDRSKLSEGWDSMVTVAGNVATKLGQDPSVVQMLPIVPSNVGDTTSYSISMPFFTKDFVPNVSLNASSFALGTSSDLNAQIVASATGSTAFEGTVFTLKFAPLASTMRGIATMLEKDIQKKTPVAPQPTLVSSADEDEIDIDMDESDDAFVEEDDFDEEDIYTYEYHEPTRAERTADMFDNFAEASEWLAKHLDNVSGTHTIKDGKSILRLRLTPAKK